MVFFQGLKTKPKLYLKNGLGCEGSSRKGLCGLVAILYRDHPIFFKDGQERPFKKGTFSTFSKQKAAWNSLILKWWDVKHVNKIFQFIFFPFFFLIGSFGEVILKNLLTREETNEIRQQIQPLLNEQTGAEFSSLPWVFGVTVVGNGDVGELILYTHVYMGIINKPLNMEKNMGHFLKTLLEKSFLFKFDLYVFLLELWDATVSPNRPSSLLLLCWWLPQWFRSLLNLHIC